MSSKKVPDQKVSKGKGKKGKGNGKKNKSSKGQPVFSNFNTVMSKSYGCVPGQFDAQLNHTFYQRSFNEGKKQGTVLSGTMPIALIAYNSIVGGFNPMILIGGATYRSVALLAPSVIFPNGGPELAVANQYTRFRFKSLTVHFNGLTGTNTPACLVIGYYGDGAITEGDVTSIMFYTTPGAMQCQTWNPDKKTNVSNLLSTDDWFYVDQDTGGLDDAGLRQSYQGAIIAQWLTVPGADPSSTQGVLYIDYELELIDARSFQNFALAAHQRRAKLRKEQVRNLLKEIVTEEEGKEPLEVPAPRSKDDLSSPDLPIPILRRDPQIREQLSDDSRSEKKERKSRK